MAKISIINPSARDAINRYKLEAGADAHINLRNIKVKTPERSGTAGSQMAKRIITAYENGLQ